MRAWGSEGTPLGDGYAGNRLSPIPIGTASNWSAVAAGSSYTVATRSDGTLWSCGQNPHGQLGDNTVNDHAAATQVGALANWASVAVGGNFAADHTAAVKSDHTLWTWGFNQDGELGDGTQIERHGPVQVGADNHWSTVAAGAAHTVALKTDGTLWVWGNNFYGQLGDGTQTQRLSPVQVGTDTNWVTVSTGQVFTTAIKSDGTLWAWGRNNSGQLGDGSVTDRHAPVQIGTDTDWVSVSAGYEYTGAVKSDGTLWAWGANAAGSWVTARRSTDTRRCRSAPTPIGRLSLQPNCTVKRSSRTGRCGRGATTTRAGSATGPR